jgi:hypothetical protein
VVATWAQKNAKGNPDPAVAYRISGAACVIHIAIAPDYPAVGVLNTDFGGDYYRLWRKRLRLRRQSLHHGHGQPPARTDAFAIPRLVHAWADRSRRAARGTGRAAPAPTPRPPLGGSS